MLLDKEVLKLQTWAFRISQDYFYFFIFLKNFFTVWLSETGIPFHVQSMNV